MKIKDIFTNVINKFRPTTQTINMEEEKVTAEMTAGLQNKDISEMPEIMEVEKFSEIIPNEISETITEAEFDNEEDDKHAGCKELVQKKCICQSCGNIYYYSDEEIQNVANIFVGKFYTSSQIDDFRQCPRCGSFDTMYKDVSFWIDDKGNCIDVEESALIRPISPDTFQKTHHDFGHCTP